MTVRIHLFSGNDWNEQVPRGRCHCGKRIGYNNIVSYTTGTTNISTCILTQTYAWQGIKIKKMRRHVFAEKGTVYNFILTQIIFETPPPPPPPPIPSPVDYIHIFYNISLSIRRHNLLPVLYGAPSVTCIHNYTQYEISYSQRIRGIITLLNTC